MAVLGSGVWYNGKSNGAISHWHSGVELQGLGRDRLSRPEEHWLSRPGVSGRLHQPGGDQQHLLPPAGHARGLGLGKKSPASTGFSVRREASPELHPWGTTIHTERD